MQDRPLTPLRDLAGLVMRMRNAQRAYFANRSPDNLKAAKSLEAAVDEAVNDVLNGRTSQPSLLGDFLPDPRNRRRK